MGESLQLHYFSSGESKPPIPRLSRYRAYHSGDTSICGVSSIRDWENEAQWSEAPMTQTLVHEMTQTQVV